MSLFSTTYLPLNLMAEEQTCRLIFAHSLIHCLPPFNISSNWMATDEQASNFLFCVLLASFSHARQKQFLLKGVRTAFDSNSFGKIYIYTVLFITYMGKASLRSYTAQFFVLNFLPYNSDTQDTSSWFCVNDRLADAGSVTLTRFISKSFILRFPSLRICFLSVSLQKGRE